MSDIRLMVVEDEPVVSLDIQRRLRDLGYGEPLLAASAAEAVDKALEHNPSLILMDIVLEGDMDGIDAAAEIRKRRDIPVVYLTGHSDPDILQRAKITEPFGYIIKPFEDKELKSCIEMALYKHQMERRLLENERWLATTLRSIGDAVVSTDEQGRIRFLNPVAEAMLGKDGEDLLGRPFRQAVRLEREEADAEAEDPVARALDTCAQGSTWRPAESWLLHSADGRHLPVDISASAIRGERGHCSCVVLVLRDITGPRKAEEALRQSVRDLRRTLEETVAALGVTSEKRDPYTAGHQQRVAQLACAMAEELGLAPEAVEGIRVAALLHDIGKIYVPAEILAKPSRLSTIEMSIMRTHVEAGHDILKNVSFPWPVADIVVQHHERLDGSGYPAGITDRDILPESRIVMVADVVEAMSSHRPYRPALGVQTALDEVGRQRGAMLDEDAVAACMRLFRNGFTFEGQGA